MYEQATQNNNLSGPSARIEPTAPPITASIHETHDHLCKLIIEAEEMRVTLCGSRPVEGSEQRQPPTSLHDHAHRTRQPVTRLGAILDQIRAVTIG